MDVKFSLERVSGSVNLEEIGQPASTIVSLVCDTRFKELLKVASEGLCAYLDIIKVQYTMCISCECHKVHNGKCVVIVSEHYKSCLRDLLTETREETGR
jgi:hypothetical protein